MTKTTVINPQTLSNILLDRSLPEFIRNDNPMFEAFLSAYYEWMEQQYNPLDVVKNLRNYRDVDATVDKFIQYFCDEFMTSIPSNVLADRRLLLKQIRNFYQIKGTQDAYRFLFRVLYNETIDFYYPQTDTMILDGGTWIQDTTIKIDVGSIDLSNLAWLFNGTLMGQTSKAQANIGSITNYTDRGDNILELYLVNLKGEFVHGETITVTPNDSNHPTFTVKEVYKAITITDPGTKYIVGDRFNLVNNGTTIIGYGNITQVGRGPVISISIGAAGTGYNGSLRDINNFLYMPLDAEYDDSNTSGLLLDAKLHDIASELLNHAITPRTVTDVPDQIIFIDTPLEIGSGAAGHISHVSQDGQILEIVLDSEGANYLDPIPEIVTLTGSGGSINVVGGGGGIIQTELISFPTVDIGDNVTVDFTPATGTGATATPVAGGAEISYPGYYANSQNQLDTFSRLEDSYYYQQFSYVILSSLSHDKWSAIVNRILHPAGLISFAKLRLYDPPLQECQVSFDNSAVTITT